MPMSMGKKVMPGLKELVAILIRQNFDNYDTCIVIDSRTGIPEGSTGSGKSHLAQHVAIMINPQVYHIGRCTVFMDDWQTFKRLILQDHTPFIPSVVDEAHHFLDSRDHSSRRSKFAIKMYNSKRKWNRYDLLCTPSIWGLDKRIRRYRCQFRLRVKERGVVEVFRNNGRWDEARDKWGRFYTKILTDALPFDIEEQYNHYYQVVEARLLESRQEQMDALDTAW